MSEQGSELEAFSKLIEALDPWLGEVVLVGGWAHRLYRLHAHARTLSYLPLATLDGDVAVPPKLKKEESSVRKRLLAAGFADTCAQRVQAKAVASFAHQTVFLLEFPLLVGYGFAEPGPLRSR